MVVTSDSPEPAATTPATVPRYPTPAEAASRVARLFPAVYRRFHAGQRLNGAAFPMTRRSLDVLLHLARSGPLTVGEQAEHLGLRRNSASELLQRLEARGLVARVRDERDGRRVLVWLTDAGREVMVSVGNVLAPDLLVEEMERLEPSDRATIVRGFELLANGPPSGERSSGARPPLPGGRPRAAFEPPPQPTQRPKGPDR
jgi:DNA-binding MarR family transcriptional regulator